MDTGSRNCIIFGAIFITVCLCIFGYIYYHYKDFEETEVLIVPSNCSTTTKTEEYQDKNGDYKTRKIKETRCDLQYSYTYRGQFYTYTRRAEWYSGTKTEILAIDPNHPESADDPSVLKTLGWIFGGFGVFMLFIGFVSVKKRGSV